MAPAVVDFQFRKSNGITGTIYDAYYDVTTLPLAVDDVVIIGLCVAPRGGGSIWFNEYATESPQSLVDGCFSLDGGADNGVPASTLATDGVMCDIYVQTITAAMLDDGTGNALERIGWGAGSASNDYYGTGFAVWVVRGAAFDSLGAGLSIADPSPFTGPVNLSITGLGTVGTNQLMFAVGGLNGDGAGDPVLTSSDDVTFTAAEVTDQWTNASFDTSSFVSRVCHAVEGDDATGMTFTFDSSPSGSTFTLSTVDPLCSMAVAYVNFAAEENAGFDTWAWMG